MATSKPRRRSGTRKTATTLTDIPDDIVAEIFLRLPAAEELVRASAACVSFRRLDADKSFLRRFRRLHDPPLLAFFDRDGFHHPLPPHPSAPAATALADAADLSFSFFPDHRQWSVQNIREGRVLLLRPGASKQPQISMEAAVCDPLHRKYVLLPPVPDDLAASVSHHPATEHEPWCEAFLVPLRQEAETAFGVMWMVHFTTRLAAIVYSSNTEQWQAVASKEWNELLFGQGESTMVSLIDRHFYGRHYAYGCFYWESTIIGKKDLLVFDTRRMEFSSCEVPPTESCPCTGLAIVEAGEARLGLFSIHVEAENFDLCYYIKRNKCESSSQWQLEKTIPICSGSRLDITAATGRYLLLGKFGPMRIVDSIPHQDLDYNSVDAKTLEFARVCTKSSGFAFSKTWIYTNFPPSLSSPKI